MLYYNTVNDLLKTYLHELMQVDEFSSFRLVGGTALSLQIGHRISVDIDLFSDAFYGSIDFDAIDRYLEQKYEYVSHSANIPAALGKSYIIGATKDNAVKLDVYYTDAFIQPARIEDGIRMATTDEIVAMKMDVIQRSGRKKDFWDVHELLQTYSIDQMLELHEKRYAYTHDRNLLLRNFKDFNNAADDLEPICLKGKYWAFIKEDISETVAAFLKQKA